AARDRLAMHQLDRHDGEASVIDAVDEIADLQIGDRSIAGGRRDRRRRRRARAGRAAGRAGAVDRLEAADDRWAHVHRTADLRARAAATRAAGRAGAAHDSVDARPERRARSAVAVRLLSGAMVAAGPAVEDVVAR